MNKYKIVLKSEEGEIKSQLVEKLTFPEAAAIAYRLRAELKFAYAIESVAKLKN